MSFKFTLAGLVIPGELKNIYFALDTAKQTDPSAITVDGIQIFNCVFYIIKIIFIKIPIDLEKTGEIEGFDKSRSIMIDSMVVLCYAFKLYLSQQTNFHEIDEYLNDIWDGETQE